MDKSWFQQQLRAIYAAPALYLAAVFAVGAAVWWVAGQYYSERISTMKEQLVLVEGQRDEYKNKLSGASPDEAKARLEKLEASLAALAPRKLSNEQTKTLQAALLIVGSIVILHDVSCADCNAYGNSIDTAFRAGAWQVVNSPLIGPNVFPRSGLGVSVANPQSPSPQEAAILKSFKSANVPFDIIAKTPPPPPPPPQPAGGPAIAQVPYPDVFIVIVSPQ